MIEEAGLMPSFWIYYEIKKLMKLFKLLVLGSLFFASHLTGYSQNILIDPVKKIDEFTKNLSVEVVPFEEVLKGKKVLKIPLSVQAGKNTMIGISYYKSKEEVEFYRIAIIKSIDLGCVSKYDGKRLVLFEDGETLTLQQLSETDCDGTISPYYYFASPETIKTDSNDDFQAEQLKFIEKFMTSKVSKIRIYGTKYYDEIEFRPEVSDIIEKMLTKIEESLN